MTNTIDGFTFDVPAAESQIVELAPVSYTHLDVYKRQVGVLSHDYSFDIDREYKYQILWAYVSRTAYDERYRIVTKEIPEIKIINVENERPDMLNFFKECNCFIPVLNEDHQLKAGGYFYYLEI